MIVVQLPLLGFIALFNAPAPQEWGLRGFLFFEPVDRALVFGDTERPWTLGTSHIQGSWGPRCDLGLFGSGTPFWALWNILSFTDRLKNK